jgi:Zn finger protein HypA/HybF involved in hydrogenase expression
MSDYPLTLDTIGKLIDHGFIGQGWCRSCQRGGSVNLDAVAAKVGRDWVFIQRKWPVTCPYCGSDDVETRIAAGERLWRPGN